MHKPAFNVIIFQIKKTTIALFLASVLNLTALTAQNDCIRDFDFMVNKIRGDYPGYNDKISDDNSDQLKLLEKAIRQKITAFPDSCGYYLSEYTAFFRDNHLRVNRIRNLDSQQDEAVAITPGDKKLFIDIDSLHQKTKELAGIEGVWEGFRDKFFIVRAGKNYTGVVINKQGWEQGEILYKLEFVNDTLFDVTLFFTDGEAGEYKKRASLHLNGKILELHNDTRFVRMSDSPLQDRSLLYSYLPQFPNGVNTYPLALYLDDSTYYLRIPGFYNELGNEFVRKHLDEILVRPNLIIDIRNNGGGQDQYYQELKKIVYSKPYESKGVEWYASAGNIKFFEDAMAKGEIRDGEEGLKWTITLVEAMKRKRGGFVTHPYSETESSVVEMDTVYPYPRNIGIIINEGNASAAEQFLLAAQQSDKVILFGNCSTAGILDYSNITPNTLPSGNFQLWCPMTRSKRLPENPIDNVGIAPDVIIPYPATEQLYDHLDIWVSYVKNYLTFLKGESR